MIGFVTCARCPDWMEPTTDGATDGQQKWKVHSLTPEHQANQAAYEASLCPTCKGSGRLPKEEIL